MANTFAAWEREYKAGVNALDSANFSKAIQHLKNAVNLAQNTNAVLPALHTRLMLADAYRMSGDFKTATEEYSDIIAKSTNNPQLRTVEILAQGSLGMLSAGVNQMKAIGALEKAVTMIRQTKVERLPDFAPLIMGLAALYMEAGNFVKAEDVANYALSYSKETLGTHDETTLACMNLCAIVAQLAGKPDKADDLKREIISKKEGGRGGKMNMLGISQSLSDVRLPDDTDNDTTNSTRKTSSGSKGKSAAADSKKNNTSKKSTKQIAEPPEADEKTQHKPGPELTIQASESQADDATLKKTSAKGTNSVSKSTRKESVESAPPSNVVAFPKKNTDTSRSEEKDKKKTSLESSVSNATRTPREKSPLELADALVREAWNQSNAQARKLAWEALGLSNDCANAYLLLADKELRPSKRIALFRLAIDTATRTLEPGWEERYAGHGWFALETRPLIRAMAMLASELREREELQEALSIYERLLKLNPDDNLGTRYEYACCLYEAQCNDELEKLLKQYSDDGGAALLYTKALAVFRKGLDQKAANKALLKAFDANPFVPLFISERVELPKKDPVSLAGFGDENEAAEYVRIGMLNWHETNGARKWMAKVLEKELIKSFEDVKMVKDVIAELQIDI